MIQWPTSQPLIREQYATTRHDVRPTEAELSPDWHRIEFSSSALGTFDLFWKGVAVADGMSLGARTKAALRATLAKRGVTPDAE